MTETLRDDSPSVRLARQKLEYLDGITDLKDVTKIAMHAGGALLGDGTLLRAYVHPRVVGGRRGSMDFSLWQGEDWKLLRIGNDGVTLRMANPIQTSGAFREDSYGYRAPTFWRHSASVPGTAIRYTTPDLNAPNEMGDFSVVRFVPEDDQDMLRKAFTTVAEAMGDVEGELESLLDRVGLALPPEPEQTQHAA